MRFGLVLFPLWCYEMCIYFLSVRVAYMREVWQSENKEREVKCRETDDKIRRGWLKGRPNPAKKQE
jgi:hypothetical protein